MARLFYMSLPGVGRWDLTMKQVGAQLRPYSDFLWTAKTAAQAGKPVLTWRAATKAEAWEFKTRLDERWEQQARKARRSSRRRDRHVRQKPAGVWVVLEPPPWQPEEPDDTFDAFLDAKSVHEDPRCGRNAEVARLDYDREGRALLLDRLPESYRPADLEDEPPPPTAAKPHGDLIWLRPNTDTLERQIYALRDLDNAPSPRLAPLVRLVSTHAQWPDIEPAPLDEGAWQFLKRGHDGGLRDGTEEQRRFVSIALGTQDFAVLEGPPGSGKTTAICELIVQLLQQEKRILLVASMHVAVDNVLERLIAAQECLPNNVVRDAFAADYSYLSKLWEALSPDPLLGEHETDYRWLSQVYVSVQPTTATGQLIWHSLGVKTIDLIHENVHVDAIHDDLDELVVDADILEAIIGSPDAEKKAGKKAKEIELKLTGRLRKHRADPRFEKLSERLERLRERHEAGQLHSIAFLKELLDLARDVVAAEKETPPQEDEDRGKTALTELFDEARNPETPIVVERIVTDIDEIVRHVRFPGWQQTTAGEREVKKALRGTLFKYKLHSDAELFEKAYGYIVQYY